MYRNKKVITYSIKYKKNEDGKVKATAKRVRSLPATREKKSSSKKKATEEKKEKKKKNKTKTKKRTTSRAAEIALLKRKLGRLSK
ncbi:unnamed protein product [Ectocarpus sp. 8 AP-2014]